MYMQAENGGKTSTSGRSTSCNAKGLMEPGSGMRSEVWERSNQEWVFLIWMRRSETHVDMRSGRSIRSYPERFLYQGDCLRKE